ncbi:probable 28S ribosomal protein S6, mitochondrial [Schistocerca americana]|uniref:probable 28S ribosomal protein S6, mitochondrial isoform X1 n=1 Tax=Schistocerca piceifrons TaxID=274613 RepID=UPI001F4F1149|nr:probable 28S ribosomal protein S6, mitochondrial [Schistocerca americana]XP_047102075.1 probable 28S ribosomal protein S6, mitochondrial isoform X1 [Schistocerca piceifrons]XP_047102076.1 probable 28S ribosomal protein S6, mitochondrial isoform X2 [Schistocerca piceifrons]XP_049783279.1 probable 28S ribosomal protein S6, mitochondrial [Schistocerca cancellata]XP_049953074.1 probable 28S ribosomal protein S6, mitochondrial [Schistocerca serialis cubense]XP_049953075.1 probable 28S ribosomal 
MPTYEMPLLIKTLSRPETFVVLKRASQTIFDKGGVIRKIENLGTRQLPFKIRKHGLVEKKASYFLIEFDTSPKTIDYLIDEFHRDVDVLRSRIYRSHEKEEFECTFEEECLPAAYRKDVQKLLEIAKKDAKPKFKPNTSLDYYPFNK